MLGGWIGKDIQAISSQNLAVVTTVIPFSEANEAM
jgi:hypothetical protein